MTILKTSVAVVVGAAALYGLQKTTPLYSEITSPIVNAGKAGERVEGNMFAFNLTRVRVARKFETEAFGKTKSYTSSGVWIIAEAQAEAMRESTSLTTAYWIGGDGIRYKLTDRVPPIPGYLPAETFEPGIASPTLMVFEVPETAIMDGKLAVSRSAIYPLDQEVQIGLTDMPTVEDQITIRQNEEGTAWSLSPE